MSNGLLRVIVSVIAIPGILAASFFGGYFFLLFVSAIALISVYEFSVLVRGKNSHVNFTAGIVSVLALLLNTFFRVIDNYFLLLVIIAVLSIVELFRNRDSAILNFAGTLLVIFYIGLFSSALILLREFYQSHDDYFKGGWIIVAVFATIWVCDSAAYYIGTAFGKHKLFPRVSPKKSWEGAIAGFVFAIIAMVIAKNIIVDFLSWNSIIGIGVIVGVLGQAGDLIESLFKRDSGIKDSSNLIPGHGGIFDRFDSLIFSAPFILILIKIFES